MPGSLVFFVFFESAEQDKRHKNECNNCHQGKDESRRARIGEVVSNYSGCHHGGGQAQEASNDIGDVGDLQCPKQGIGDLMGDLAYELGCKREEQ